MFASVFAAASVALTAMCASSDLEEPAAAVRELYRVEKQILDDPRSLSRDAKQALLDRIPALFASELSAAWRADQRLARETGSYGKLDYNPFLVAQDVAEGWFDTLRFSLTQDSDRAARVTAAFTNGAAREVVYCMIRQTDGEWRIADVLMPGVGGQRERVSLLALLTGGAPGCRGLVGRP